MASLESASVGRNRCLVRIARARICANVNPRENGQKFGIQFVRQFADNLQTKLRVQKCKFPIEELLFPLSLLEIHFGMIVIFPLVKCKLNLFRISCCRCLFSLQIIRVALKTTLSQIVSSKPIKVSLSFLHIQSPVSKVLMLLSKSGNSWMKRLPIVVCIGNQMATNEIRKSFLARFVKILRISHQTLPCQFCNFTCEIIN